MDPVIGSALISAGSSLFGGLFGNKKGPSTYQQTQEAMGAQAKYAREYGEQYGFDPLTLLGVSSPVAGGQIMDNPMGQAIADAGMILADAWSKRTDAQKLQRSKERINELQTKLDHQTLRPKVGGVYAKREMSPMLRPANGGGNVGKTASVANGEAGKAAPFDSSVHSGLASDASYDVGDDLTGVQAAVKKDVPAFRAFGHDFYGSGMFSSGQQFEDGIGEGPLSWALSPVLMADAFANESYKLGRDVGANRWKQKLLNGYAENGGAWFDPYAISRPKMAGGRVKSPKKNSAGKRPFQP